MVLVNEAGSVMETVGSFPRQDDAELAAKMFPNAKVVETDRASILYYFPDFGRFENWAASLQAYDDFFERFLQEHKDIAWADPEEREEEFMAWWYNLPVRGA